MPFPALSALEARLGLDAGSLEGPDKARADAALEDATALVLAEVSATKATAWETTCPKVVALVILKAARREYENPQGVVQEAIGEFSTTVSVSSGVYLTPVEASLIRRAATGRRTGFVGTVRTPSAYEED